MDHYALFDYESFYHVYNRTNNKESLFLSDQNRNFFLQRYQFYMQGFVNTYSYALLDNHFHLSISVKTEDEIVEYIIQWHFETDNQPQENAFQFLWVKSPALQQKLHAVKTHTVYASKQAEQFWLNLTTIHFSDYTSESNLDYFSYFYPSPNDATKSITPSTIWYEIGFNNNHLLKRYHTFVSTWIIEIIVSSLFILIFVFPVSQ